MLCVNCPWYDCAQFEINSTDKNDCLAFVEEGFCPYGKKYPNENDMKLIISHIFDEDE